MITLSIKYLRHFSQAQEYGLVIRIFDTIFLTASVGLP